MTTINKHLVGKTLGIHIVLDLYECDFTWIESETNRSIIKKFCNLVKDNGLTMVDKASHFFNYNSFTIIIALKESHLAVHTWPEYSYVSADIFVCNYSADNTTKAVRISEEVCKLFNSKNIKKQIIER